MKLGTKEKMSRIIDAMLYGDLITKRYLYGIVIFTLITLFSGVMAVLGMGIVYGLIAMLVGVVDLIWWQSMTLTSDELKEQGDKVKYQQRKQEQRLEKEKERATEKLRKEEEKRKKREPKSEIEKALGKIDEKTEYKITREEIKYALKRYKAKKDHREVLIDSCDSLGLKEAPAYIWADKKKYYLMVIGGDEPLLLDFPLEYNMKLHYETGVKSSPDVEYNEYKGVSVVALAFSPFLPDYYQKRTEYGTAFYKNLYRLGKDMYFTNSSAKNVLDITGADFEVEDDITKDMRYGEDFKNAYKANLLWRDGVLSSAEYKNRITGLLSSLARADIRFDDFNRILEQMYEYNFITKAYLEFYIDYRKKYRETKVK
ncbi:MAG: hypothetical protein ACTTG8_01915 [Catonella sp.]|uniref:hypothetical protein n=1 Tax=Catonella sp. TaxID=2382125 RepID=UPI003FA066AB